MLFHMIPRTWLNTLAAATLAFSFAPAATAQPTSAPPEIVASMQAQRDALFDARHLDVPAVSAEIAKAVGESKRLEAAGQFRAALDRLHVLEKYAPFDDVPSFEVHLLASFLSLKVGDLAQQRVQMDRATAFAFLLANRVGKGDTPDDPARLVMVTEISDWARTHGGDVTGVKDYPYRGRELLLVTYAGPRTAGQARQFYVELDPRTRAMANRAVQRFAPFEVAAMTGEAKAALEKARAKRKAFLDDRGFDYLRLRDLVNTQMKAAIELDAQGKPQEALAKLREIEKVRAIEDIPDPRLLSMYSYLAGRTGDAQKQRELRTYAFGLQQAMAHSGDAKSQASAMHVILVDEEYEVLADRHLKRVKQQLEQKNGRVFDALTAANDKGEESQLWFDITELYKREGEALSPAKK